MVLLLAPLWCVWALFNPFSSSRALTGDAIAPALVLLFALALLGIRRQQAGGARPRWIVDALELGADHPGLLLWLVLLALAGNASLPAGNAAIALTGAAWGFGSWIWPRVGAAILPSSSRGWPRAILLLTSVLGFVLSIPLLWPLRYLDTASYWMLPLLGSALGGLSLLASPATGITWRPWQWLLAAQLAAPLARSIGLVDAWPLALLLVLLLLATSARLQARIKPTTAVDVRALAWAIAPLCFFAVVCAGLHAAVLPAEWSRQVHARGIVAILSETICLPLCGAAGIVAWQLDRVVGCRPSAVALVLGLGALAFSATHAAERVQAWIQPPRFLMQTNLDPHAFYVASPALAAFATAACLLRLQLLLHGSRPAAWPVCVAAGASVVLAARWVPQHGPVHAVWSACAVLALLAGLDLALHALRARRTRTTPR